MFFVFKAFSYNTVCEIKNASDLSETFGIFRVALRLVLYIAQHIFTLGFQFFFVLFQ